MTKRGRAVNALLESPGAEESLGRVPGSHSEPPVQRGRQVPALELEQARRTHSGQAAREEFAGRLMAEALRVHLARRRVQRAPFRYRNPEWVPS